MLRWSLNATSCQYPSSTANAMETRSHTRSQDDARSDAAHILRNNLIHRAGRCTMPPPRARVRPKVLLVPA